MNSRISYNFRNREAILRKKFSPYDCSKDNLQQSLAFGGTHDRRYSRAWRLGHFLYQSCLLLEYPMMCIQMVFRLQLAQYMPRSSCLHELSNEICILQFMSYKHSVVLTVSVSVDKLDCVENKCVVDGMIWSTVWVHLGVESDWLLCYVGCWRDYNDGNNPYIFIRVNNIQWIDYYYTLPTNWLRSF